MTKGYIALFLVVFLLPSLLCATLGLGGCTDPETAKLARETEMYNAKARAEAAPVTVIEAQTNAHLEKLRAETDTTKEMRVFDAQMARQEFATAVLEMRALNTAIIESRVSIEEMDRRIDELNAGTGGLLRNGEEAADRSWWLLLLVPIFGVTSVIGSVICSALVSMAVSKKLGAIEGRLPKWTKPRVEDLNGGETDIRRSGGEASPS